MRAETVKTLAHECGFELAGVARAEPLDGDFARYQRWAANGYAGEMQYLTDRRAVVRRDPGNLLPSARSVICVGKLYNQPLAVDRDNTATGDWAVIARYAWSRDYHDVLRESLENLARKLEDIERHEWKVCVDTAPLLERSYARQAGLGWIGRNTCLINEPMGSWFFLGEILTSLELEPDAPPPDRCGTCTSCVKACPTQAIVPVGDDVPGNEWTLDASRCISYFNIELRGAIPEEHRSQVGMNIFGCDICQDVCPWNSRAPVTADLALAPRIAPHPELEDLAYLTDGDFKNRYRATPVLRSKYEGFLRNVAVAMGASGNRKFREPLEHLARHPSLLVASHAEWALGQLEKCAELTRRS